MSEARITTQGSIVHVRRGPGINFPIVGSRNNGDMVDVVEARQGWVRIGTLQWINNNFVNTATPAETGNAIMVAPHRSRPESRHWRILTGFDSNSAELKPVHRQWLSGFAASQVRAGQWVWVRGTASHLGRTANNQILSERRAQAVQNFLVNNCRVPANHVTGISGVGESRAQGSQTNDSAQDRAVEVIITNNIIELPPAFITGASPFNTVFWIKYLGSGSGGEAAVGTVAIFIIRTRHDYWQKYLYAGAGVGGGSPISWGEGLPAGQGWVRFTTTQLQFVGGFEGLAGTHEASLQIGSIGGSLFDFDFPHGPRRLELATGSGFSIGVSETVGSLIAAGGVECSGSWRTY